MNSCGSQPQIISGSFVSPTTYQENKDEKHTQQLMGFFLERKL